MISVSFKKMYILCGSVNRETGPFQEVCLHTTTNLDVRSVIHVGRFIFILSISFHLLPYFCTSSLLSGLVFLPFSLPLVSSIFTHISADIFSCLITELFSVSIPLHTQ